MKLPVIRGIIRRRLLINFRVDPEAMQSQLPSRFRPKLQAGFAIAGICLIRLEAIRPRGLPAVLGLSSENAAHRIAVVWDGAAGEAREGVFIPRRDTNSFANSLVGGRLFPGEHHRATFVVREDERSLDLRMQSHDGAVVVDVRGRFGGTFPESSCFANLAAASRFFEAGSLGYSVTRESGRLDGLELRTEGWTVEALTVDHVQSSYFSDLERFPTGSVAFDCALLMRDLPHEWWSAGDLRV